MNPCDTCPRDHAALKRDPFAWSQLEQCGVQESYDDTPGAVRDYFVANCSCGTTLLLPRSYNP